MWRAPRYRAKCFPRKAGAIRRHIRPATMPGTKRQVDNIGCGPDAYCPLRIKGVCHSPQTKPLTRIGARISAYISAHLLDRLILKPSPAFWSSPGTTPEVDRVSNRFLTITIGSLYIIEEVDFICGGCPSLSSAGGMRQRSRLGISRLASDHFSEGFNL